MSTTTETPAAALVKREDSKGTDIIRTPGEYTEAMKTWAGHYHVLSPFTSVTGLAESHAIIASRVNISANPDDGDVYGDVPYLKGGEVALSKIGLRKIAECAAITTRTARMDPRTIMFYWEVKAVASYRSIDGSTVSREATVEWDLRDGSPRLKGWTANQISEARKHGLRAAETRAINAAIREFGVHQKYTRDELRKPFLVLRNVYQPDTRDPEIKKLVTENFLRGTAQLYAGTPEPQQEWDDLDADAPGQGEPKPVGKGSAAPPADEPPVEGAVRIEDVQEKPGTSAAGRAYVRYLITDSNGVEHSTFDGDLCDIASDAKKSRAWVSLRFQKKGEYTNLVGIDPAGQQPALPMDAERY